MATELSGNAVLLTEQEFKELSVFVYDQYGIDLSRKKQLIEGRLSNTLKARGLSSFSQYMKLLRSDKSGTELTNFLNKITTNYSYFARENDHFEFLAQVVLPYMEKNRGRIKDLRIWSAGCSSGQEPYNLAMAIDQYFGPRKAGWDTTILATDISANMLTKAQQGLYPAKDLENLPLRWKQLYFEKVDKEQFRVCEKIRKEVVFRPFNLMDQFVYKKPFDIIFCRNVMIYFDQPTTNRLVQKFYQATAEGGYLFIGHSESINKQASGYQCLAPSIYQKVTNERK